MKTLLRKPVLLLVLLAFPGAAACDETTNINVGDDDDNDDDNDNDDDGSSDADSDADTDADTDADADGDGDTDDPLCGAVNQTCCDMSSTQPTTCDGTNLTCSMGYPDAGDAICRYSCTPVPCTTLEGEWGTCMVGEFAGPIYVGLCIGTQAEMCDYSAQCQDYFGVASAECISGIESVPICLDTGCNYQANCPGGHYCSSTYGDACIPI